MMKLTINLLIAISFIIIAGCDGNIMDVTRNSIMDNIVIIQDTFDDATLNPDHFYIDNNVVIAGGKLSINTGIDAWIGLHSVKFKLPAVIECYGKLPYASSYSGNFFMIRTSPVVGETSFQLHTNWDSSTINILTRFEYTGTSGIHEAYDTGYDDDNYYTFKIAVDYNKVQFFINNSLIKTNYYSFNENDIFQSHLTTRSANFGGDIDWIKIETSGIVGF
jgi:hypothetical protein